MNKDRSVQCTYLSGSTFPLGQTPVTCTATNAAGTTQRQFTSGSTFPLDEITTVGCTATDGVGNTASGNFRVSVVDTTAPTLTLADQGAEATSPDGAKVTYTGFSATDSVDGNVNVDCIPESGTQFALGSTNVQCSAIDSRGNTGSGTIRVSVVDTTAPVTSIDASSVQSNGLANLRTATFIVGGTDAVGIASYECSIDGQAISPCVNPVSVSGLADGSHTFVVVGVDGAGNKDGSPERVSWEVDATAPVISGLPQSPLSVITTTSAGAKITYTLSTATDGRDGAVIITCNPASGSIARARNNYSYVYCKRCSNTAQSSFTVKVTYPKWSGIKQPINSDGSSVFKLGSTVPVKFNLGSVTDATAKLFVAKVSSGVLGSETEAVTSTPASSGNNFRFDGSQYIYNLGTKNGYSAGTYQLRIDIGDRSTNSVLISLRR